MWQPAQLPSIAAKLSERGLKLDPSQLTDLTGPTMGAIVSLNGCTASFVSPQGLVVTNHHCAYGAIQYNSTAEKNLIQEGFLARSTEEELPGDPNMRLYVTEEIRDVTKDVTARLKDSMSGLERYQAIDKAEKVIVAKCEKPGVRCDVYNFHGGLSFQLVRQREIKDVRLVYAPPSAIGKFGGDVDNWMWPRHTGDFGFLRGYVGKDGSSRAYDATNVPFVPKYHLPINAGGVEPGDFVMVTGYPGRTNRYRLTQEIKDAIDWYYPTNIRYYTEILDIINSAGAKDPAVAVKYASSVASFNNYLKNFRGQLEGLGKAHAVTFKQNKEDALVKWLGDQAGETAALAGDIRELRALLDEQRKLRERDQVLGYLNRTGLYSAAYTIYRTAGERTKKDLDREEGYQNRDEIKLEGTLKQQERRVDPAVDQALMTHFLKRYVQLPTGQRVAALDAWLGTGVVADEVVAAKVAGLYDKTELTRTEGRLKWFKAKKADIEASTDPALAFMVKLMPDLLAIEQARKERQGNELKLRPRYMRAMIAYNDANGQAVYPDANSSLRVTFGRVQGIKKDGVEFTPFTTGEGIVAKTTGVEPFNTPQSEYERLVAKDYGRYASPTLGTLPVNFLADLDITGGNSGSPTLDSHGRLVGLAFDSNWDSVSADWIYEQPLTRSIQVDVRYMLWVMDKIDNAHNLLREMGVQ
ncbi:S46 family peptidase [Tahibacter amnicola]|uniref:Dipeptidyl-peptidase n=2 Tax=Tahibacter amnicola TaxID=2976241 RepID=A0ABY6BSB5_9GAMM|nr:S46 family peptidase [Tahibacter amnicola]UXI70662.1 S46 family peptidase [Tahibacter amnicola]